MPTAVRMYVRLSEAPPSHELVSLRDDFLRAMTLTTEDFYFEGPLMVVPDDERKYMPVKDDNSFWLAVNLSRSYFGHEYQRGNPELFVQIAEWLQGRLEGSEIYYGHDVDDENVSLFDEETRQRLLELYRTRAGETA